MVDYVDLVRVNELVDERRQIDRAIEIFSDGGRVAQMTVMTRADAEVQEGATVPTLYMNFPPQMVPAVIALWEQRKNEITHELENMGLTNIGGNGADRRVAPAAAPAPSPAPAPSRGPRRR